MDTWWGSRSREHQLSEAIYNFTSFFIYFMLKFNTKGLLVPNHNISSTLTELIEYFVDGIPSERRQLLIDKYIKYSEELKKTCQNCELLQWG